MQDGKLTISESAISSAIASSALSRLDWLLWEFIKWALALRRIWEWVNLSYDEWLTEDGEADQDHEAQFSEREIRK